MRNKIKLLLLTMLFAHLLPAQKVEVSKGKPSEYELDLEYIGKNDKYLFYHGNVYNDMGEYILIADITSLDIIEKKKISDFKLKGKLEKVFVFDNEIQFFTSEPEFKKKPYRIVYNLRANVYTADASFKLINKVEMGTFEGNEDPYIYYLNNGKLIVVSDGKTIQHYTRDFKLFTEPLSTIEDPLPVNYKYIKIPLNFLGNKEKTPEEEKYFYSFGNRNDLRYYAKAEFVKDIKCVKTEGHIRSLEVITYDTIKNFRKDNYQFEIRESSYLMDYNISLQKDGRIIIIGVYQDKDIKDGKIHLGLFTKIIEPDLMDKIPAYYVEMESKTADEFQKTYISEYLFGYMGYQTYYISNLVYKNSYLSHHRNYECKKGSYEYMLINRQTGAISFEKLKTPFSCMKRNVFMSGFLTKRFGDSMEWICFNDNKYNVGKSADGEDLTEYGFNPDSLAFSFITFTVNSGFGKRRLIYETGKEGFIPEMSYSQTYMSEADANGRFEIITLAYDTEKKNFRIYRFVVDMKE